MGAPIGNVNGAKNIRLFEDALRRELLANNGKKLRLIVAKLTYMALKGNIQAAQMVVDRIEGKARQQVVHTGIDDGPVAIEFTQRERARRVAFLLAANDPEHVAVAAVPKRGNGT